MPANAPSPLGEALTSHARWLQEHYGVDSVAVTVAAPNEILGVEVTVRPTSGIGVSLLIQEDYPEQLILTIGDEARRELLPGEKDGLELVTLIFAVVESVIENGVDERIFGSHGGPLARFMDLTTKDGRVVRIRYYKGLLAPLLRPFSRKEVLRHPPYGGETDRP